MKKIKRNTKSIDGIYIMEPIHTFREGVIGEENYYTEEQLIELPPIITSTAKYPICVKNCCRIPIRVKQAPGGSPIQKELFRALNALCC